MSDYFEEKMIMNDMSRSILERAQDLMAVRQRPDTSPGRTVTLGDFFRGAIGAAFGGGLARGIGHLFGLSERSVDKLETMGMGAGAIMNTGVKIAELNHDQMDQYAQRMIKQRQEAFRFGAIAGLMRGGYFGKTAAVSLALSPMTFFLPAAITAAGLQAAGNIGGATAALALSPDEADKKVAELQAEKLMLKKKLRELKAKRKSETVEKVIMQRK